MNKAIVKRCIQLARRHLDDHVEFSHYPHFSFVIARNQVVEWGTNRPGTPSVYFGYHESAKIHAELDAYRNARGLLNGEQFELINIRLNRRSETRISAPCRQCSAWLAAVGCKQVYFSMPNEQFARVAVTG